MDTAHLNHGCSFNRATVKNLRGAKPELTQHDSMTAQKWQVCQVRLLLPSRQRGEAEGTGCGGGGIRGMKLLKSWIP